MSQKIKALVCSKCGILTPDSNDFITGYVACHHSHNRSTHKLSIVEVDENSKIVNILPILLAKMEARKLGKYEGEL